MEEFEGAAQKLRRQLSERNEEVDDWERKYKQSEQAKKRAENQRDDLQMELDSAAKQISNVARMESKHQKELAALKEPIKVMANERDEALRAGRASDEKAYRIK